MSEAVSMKVQMASITQHKSIFIFASICFIGCLFGQESVFDCTQQTSCQKCIQKGSRCTWCKDDVYRQGKRSYFPRCDFLENHKKRACKSISDPSSNYSLSEGNVGLGGENRVFPQNITLYLRPGRPTTVNVRVKTPSDFPVDLYYLMDLSYSMRDDLAQITNLGTLLGSQLKNVTSNFRLGFGGFVDKNLGPYTLSNKAEIDTKIKTFKVQQTFGYRNYLPLDLNTSKFQDTVEKTKISYNIDGPEGSLDAMMQVVACDKEIGWRDKKKARRIIIVTTDASFHYAGDGLLGGVALPNDGKCHMTDGLYTFSSKMDYPSLSFLRDRMVEAEIVPIFATTGNLDLYKLVQYSHVNYYPVCRLYETGECRVYRVQNFFGVSSGATAAQLNSDSSNIVPLVKEAYEKISRIVKVSTQKVNGLNVKLMAKCGLLDTFGFDLPGTTAEDYLLGKGVNYATALASCSEKKSWENKDGCTEVEFGEEVQFNVTMEASACSKQLKEVTGFRIRTSFDDVFVNLKLVCDCECDAPIYQVKASPICHGNGTLRCGKCECDPPYKGRFCQCDQKTNKDDTLCKFKGKVCNDRGTCECGECVQCFPSSTPGEHIYGQYCECSNSTCPKSFGQICGGKERGSCECNQCKCKDNWTGPTCGDECINSTAGCMYNEKICNGKGSCVCGACTGCAEGYFGNFCDQCSENCPDPCVDYKECVRCKVFKTSDLSAPQCEAECRRHNITKITTVTYVEAGAGERCVAADKDDCSFVFTYRKSNTTEKIELLVQKERICPAEPDILAIILGVIAGIVGVGLALLLIWKLLATLKDRRELAKFNKDLQEVKFDTGENPLFKQATSTFKNPMYEGTSG